jgi:CDP-glucose 4,6-dehydratase
MGFWEGKRVFITGHTGFKGGWLALWLHAMGADVLGYSLPAPMQPSLFEAAKIGRQVRSKIGDIRDASHLSTAVAAFRPEIVFHMAAQPLVRRSYSDPVETYSTNVMGTLQVLESVRRAGGACVIVNVTSDKCYENREWLRGYHEGDALGGADPYSSSKACAEILTKAYRTSYFHPDQYDRHGVALLSVRAGNVIGGGDWAEDRLVPDAVRAYSSGTTLLIRNPNSTRPWQHVLEPLRGYLTVAERAWEEGPKFAEAWNFGPLESDAQPVAAVITRLSELWGSGDWTLASGEQPQEARSLKLDCSKARTRLGWTPRWDLARALPATVAWYKAFYRGEDMLRFTQDQIEQYSAAPATIGTAAG